MNNIKIHCSWDLEFDYFHEKQVELYVDHIPGNPPDENVVRFVFLLEPPEIMDLSRQAISGYERGTYQHLFTHHQGLLNAIPRSYVFPLASTWIRDYDFPEKDFSVSTLVGGKRMAPGHMLRQQLWVSQNLIGIKRRFYMSGNYNRGLQNPNGNPVLGQDKKPLFDSQFHICIENTKRENWFTEKLVDCLQTKTVPIFWGCPNISNWFNLDGFIIVDNLNDIIEACNNLDETTYNNMLSAVEDNYERSMGYADISVRLRDKIEELMNNG